MDALIPALQQRDAAVFRQVYDAYHSRLYFFVFKHTQSPFLAEETVQLTFIKIWENAARLSPQYSLAIQIFRIARSVMIDLLRQESVRRRHTIQMTGTIELQQQAADLEGRQELMQVHREIDRMAPVRKTVFTLSRMEGYSHLRIAEKLSISPKTVENHIAKAIRQIRRTLTSFL